MIAAVFNLTAACFALKSGILVGKTLVQITAVSHSSRIFFLVSSNP